MFRSNNNDGIIDIIANPSKPNFANAIKLNKSAILLINGIKKILIKAYP